MKGFQSSDVGQPVRLGPYRLEEPLGAGGMGKVWRAWDERLHRGVALKELRADSLVSNVRERLRREARAAARLNHPAIVHVYDILQGDEGDWIVMELVEGKTLRRLLNEQGALPVPTAVQLGREIAEGLAEAHAHGILHRDLKAANVMVTPSGRAKILDFGLAKELARHDLADPEPTISTPGAIIGTCHAMSPEQVLGHSLDVASDLFSLGSLLYELLTGHAPFQAETPTASLARVLAFQPPALSQERAEVPAELSQLVERLLQKDPQNRPRSAREVAEELAALTPGGSPSKAGTAGLFDLAEDLSPPTLDQRPWVVASAVQETASPRSGSGSSLERRRQMGERRLVCVVCCGLVGLEETSGEVRSLDVETLAEATLPLQDLAREICERLEGQLGSSMGNLLWLYFGYPQAHEDDAERAVRAARELVDRIDGLGVRFGPAGRRRLVARAAVHTGPAVIVARPGQDAQPHLGSTLDLASALQSAAPARGVVASAESQRLLTRSFTLEPLPSARVPGMEEPLALFRVAGALDARSGEHSAELTPLVGRDRELELLLDRFRLARAGNGQAVMVAGEAGIGKSRLLRALRQGLIGEAPLWLVGYGSPYTQSSPLAPIVELLERTLVSGVPADERLGRLAETLRRHGLPPEDLVPLLAPLLSVSAGERYPPPALSPEVRRTRTLEAVVALLAQMAERQTLVLVLEDLHWFDPSTLELLGLLLAETASLPLLLIMTFRPGFQAPWGHRSNITQLSLSHLSGQETEALVQGLAASQALPPEVLRQIVVKTDGVPLFVEELTKAAIEAGWTSGTPELPSTLNASLTTRLDRLGPARETAQIASVIGRTFSLDLLAAVSPLEGDELQRSLDELQRAELVYRRGLAPRVRYFFKHALVQDAAYASLLARDRQALHLKIAQALEGNREPEGVQPEVIAHHYSAGQDFERAWSCWLAAGQTALSRFAVAESVEHLRRSLEALEGLPPGSERDQREIASQSLAGIALSLLRGHAASEVEAAYSRVLELGDRTGSIPQELYPGLWAFYNARADLERARQLASQMLRHAEAGGEGNAGPLGLALCAWATTHAFLGDLEAAREAFEKLLTLHPPESGAALESSLGFDPRVLALGQLAQISWITGHPETALRQCQQALDLAESLGNPVSKALAVLLLGHLTLTLRDHAAALEHARTLNTLSRENAFHSWVALSDLELGCAEAELASSREQALPALRRAAEAFWIFRNTHGHDLDIGRNAAWLIEAGIRHGLLEEGEELLARTLEILQRTGERYWEPELHRLRGILALAREEKSPRAEPCFREALAAAQRMGALAMELRAAVSLGRLLRDAGRGEEARQLLSGVRQRFTEGAATPDLQEADALLAALA